jgi:AmmeMemoRadiSam system protein B/AmmeMemoRadiSam system protein A
MMQRIQPYWRPAEVKGDRLARLAAFLVVMSLAITSGACQTAEEVTPTPGTSTRTITQSPLATARPSASFSEIRPPAVADAFYPSDPALVEAMLDQFLAPAQPVDGKPIGLIVPHAGWIYSGQVAGTAFKQIDGIPYEVVVLIGPNHTRPAFDAISVYAKGAFETPLGPAPIDETLAAELVAEHERIVFDRAVHQHEHSLEVQLPFLQRVCPDCSFVPVIIGRPTPENLELLSIALANVLANRQALIVASSDFSHYPNYEDAIKVDTRSLAAIETMDDATVSAAMSAPENLQVPGLVTCACGEGPIVVTMRVSQALGADHVRILHYSNSGDVSGDTSRVVGYAAVMFWHWEPPVLTAPQQAELLSIARGSLERFLAGEDAWSVAEPPSDPLLHRNLGAFVTLTLDGELRGCIGHMYGDMPLYQAVAQAAVDAATNDSRFPPLPADLLGDVEIEVSVLSPFKRVRDISSEAEIEVGRHGLYLLYGQRRGVLLPQVPVANNWTRDQYLEQICLKAGLPEDCLKQAALYTFTAEVFGETPSH